VVVCGKAQYVSGLVKGYELKGVMECVFGEREGFVEEEGHLDALVRVRVKVEKGKQCSS
jgi:hypothetical protein